MKKAELEVLDRMPVLFFCKDRDGRYLWCNTAFSEMAGVDVVGKTAADMPWSNQQKEMEKMDQDVFRTGDSNFMPIYIVNDQQTGDTYKTNLCKWLDEFEGQPAVYTMILIMDYSHA